MNPTEVLVGSLFRGDCFRSFRIELDDYYTTSTKSLTTNICKPWRQDWLYSEIVIDLGWYPQGNGEGDGDGHLKARSGNNDSVIIKPNQNYEDFSGLFYKNHWMEDWRR